MLKIDIKEKSNILFVDDTFASLVDITQTEELKFNFSYKVSKFKALKENALRVRITVQNLIDDSDVLEYENAPTEEKINFILTEINQRKDALIKQQKSTIATVYGDITTYINNEEVSQILKANDSKQISSFYKNKIKLVSSSEAKKINKDGINNLKSKSINNDKNFLSFQNEAYKTIINGLDPSIIVDMNHLSLTPQDILNGFKKVNRLHEEIETNPEVKLRNLVVSPIKNTTENISNLKLKDKIQLIVPTFDEYASITSEVIIQKSLVNISSSLKVNFELIDNNNNSISSISKRLNLQSHIQEYNLPVIPPKVNLIRKTHTTANLEIFQVDKKATKIKIFRKIISTSDINSDEYSFISELQLKPNSRVLFPIDIFTSSFCVYRVVSENDYGELSSTFTNVVVKPQHFYQFKHIAILTSINNGGILVNVQSLPYSISSLRLMKRNITTHNEWYYIGQTYYVSIDDIIKYVDEDVEADNVYEYCCELIYKDGSVIRSGYSIIDYIPTSRGTLKLQLENLSISDDITMSSNAERFSMSQRGTSFDIKSVLPENETDTLKKLLINQGLYEHYTDEITNEREKLEKLIAYSIKRIDKTTGQIIDYGVITDSKFVESTLIKDNSMSLVSGRSYRYDIQPLLRDPETMLDETNSKIEIDKTLKKEYIVRPSKSYHPLSLRTGTITSEKGRKSRNGLHQMMYGKLGQTVSVDINLIDEVPSISYAECSKFNSNKNLIMWTIKNNVKLIDHFLILKEINGIRTLIGRVHTQFYNSSFTFYHSLTNRDIGLISYIIIPIFNQYTIGTEYETNEIIIEEINEIKQFRNKLDISNFDRVLK